MYPLFETICVKNGIVQNLEWHQKRYETSYAQMYSKSPTDKLGANILIPKECEDGLFKLRIRYNEDDKKYVFEKYISTSIETLKLVKADNLNYELKYSDRRPLNDLYKMKEGCDDVLITKNGKITDTSYANIVFTDGKKWFTPSTPLLKGTCRQRLLEEGRLFEKDISISELKYFIGFNLINAMNDLEENDFTKIENIL